MQTGQDVARLWVSGGFGLCRSCAQPHSPLSQSRPQSRPVERPQRKPACQSCRSQLQGRRSAMMEKLSRYSAVIRHRRPSALVALGNLGHGLPGISRQLWRSTHGTGGLTIPWDRAADSQ
ncbi:hypothetical protein CISG_05152 [Coccidioides immitis RMSCC 3703]|uniref:Uncharacterized protein n=2 Tax=Coccidioides immitis TaxID=5501 RepID=A0A0J8QW17_COCIT|nr:hypothetical protein CIRG_01342 [Coccidioides immitis RMSCC 2394]KMU75518.1 hypothetical protein CISG_05152 [Coccidioides immitis RMSCC 3703]